MKSKDYQYLSKFITDISQLGKKEFHQISLAKWQKVGSTIGSFLDQVQTAFTLISSWKKSTVCLQKILSKLKIDDTIKSITSELSSLFNCERAQLYLINDTTHQLEVKIHDDLLKIQPHKSIPSYVAINKVTVRLANAQEDARFDKELDTQFILPTRSVIVVPLIVEDKAIGVMEVTNKIEGEFTVDDEGLLILIAPLIGIIVRNALEYENTLLMQYKFIKLVDTSTRMFECLNLPILLTEAEYQLKQLFNVKKVQIYAIDRKTGKLVRQFGEKEIVRETGLGIVGDVLKNKKIMYLTEPHKHAMFNQLTDLQTSHPMITIPLFIKSNSQIVGICQSIYKKIGYGKSIDKLEKQEIALLEAFGSVVATCINRAQDISDVIEQQILIKLEELKQNALRLKKMAGNF